MGAEQFSGAENDGQLQSIVNNVMQQLMSKVYESSSGGAQEYEEVVALMQQVQSCGQPPEDIIRELAPDLEVGPDGLPTRRGDWTPASAPCNENARARKRTPFISFSSCACL